MELLLLIHNNLWRYWKSSIDRNGLRGSMKDSRSSIGLLHLIFPLPLGWGLTPISYPWRLNKIVFTPEDFHQICPEEYRNIGVPLENFMQIKAPPPKKLYFLTLPLKKSSVVITCPWWIPWFLNWGYRYFIHMGWVGGGGGSYFPYILLNEIQTMFSQLAKWS